MYYILSKRQPDGLLESEEFNSLDEARAYLYNKRRLYYDVLMVEEKELPLLSLVGEKI
tara:strand:+ start:2191 stop:2364 length:174 start_codon:yes stop_codon:yes gene_type:complete